MKRSLSDDTQSSPHKRSHVETTIRPSVDCTCTICIGTFVVPVVLPCDHVFCYGCIRAWSERPKDQQEETKKGFSCPLCRQQTISLDCVRRDPKAEAAVRALIAEKRRTKEGNAWILEHAKSIGNAAWDARKDRLVGIDYQELFIQAARLGDNVSRGVCCLYGFGREIDLDEAFRILSKAYKESGNLEQLIIFAEELRHEAEFCGESFRWMKFAANHNCDRAMLLLARFYEKGVGCFIDKELAAHWYHNAALAKVPEAQYKFAGFQMDGVGTPMNKVEAFSRFHTLAHKNHAAAQFRTGLCYLEGLGTARDDSKAAKWFSRAIDGGNTAAMYHIGRMFKEGRGVIQSDAKAVQYFSKAADLGDVKSHIELANVFTSGSTQLGKNFATAFRHLLFAAKHDHGDAQFQLALRLMDGQGCTRNVDRAVVWLQRASFKGHVPATTALGIHHFGKGQVEHGLELIRWSARMGDARASSWLTIDPDSIGDCSAKVPCAAKCPGPIGSEDQIKFC